MSNRQFKKRVLEYLRKHTKTGINFWIKKSKIAHGSQYFLLTVWPRRTNKLATGIFIEDCNTDFMKYSAIQYMRRYRWLKNKYQS